MKKGSQIRFWAAGLLLCSAIAGPVVVRTAAQADQSQTAQLLDKAHTLETRGRIDLAKQTWQQVLLGDPNNTEALAGLARAAKLEGKTADSKAYLDKLRAINPNDPNIAKVENLSSQQNTSTQLAEAGRLAQAGQFARAMTILRQVYGDTPPPGDAALSYYQTEAATEEGRPHAIAGLRALMDKNPQDSRYQITLGKILTYNPRTRAEGRRLLQRHPDSPEASEALRQSLVWDAQNPATAADIRSYLVKHKDPQLSASLSTLESQAAASRRSTVRQGPPPTPEELAAQAEQRARSAEDQAAYNALNAKRIGEAEQRFTTIVAKNPHDAQALAGMGYVRMNQSNFGGAISFFGQAIEEGSHDAGVERGLRDSRFYYTMQEATASLNENDLTSAQNQFQAALQMRPDSPEAMLGLGGTFLKAQLADQAIDVFGQYVRVRPGDKAAWRGLFMANYGAERYAEALAIDKRIPPAVHAQLMRDPDYLKTLASTYSALGRDADAQRVLRSALELPFPADARGLKADTQLQYAGLLMAAQHYDQASGLYRQVLAADATNTDAWSGLISTEHALGQDANALQALGAMPPQAYQTAMQQPGFETLVASIYQNQGQMEQAQGVLETFLNAQRSSGHAPFAPAQLQLANIYMQRGNTQAAYPLFREVLSATPDRPDAWKGLLSSMHSTGHDSEALAQVQQIPPNVRQKLESDPAYLQTVGSIYAGLGHPLEAMNFLNRIQQYYSSMHVTPPADIDIQSAWLLFNSQNDAPLYRALMALGNRSDLSDTQRRTVQTIWAAWAVRRANSASQIGQYKRALTILNAAAAAFPDNPAVIKALASGYAGAGLPKQAVKIFRTQDLSTATAADYKAAVGAALADNDLRDAETWLRFGLQQYPRDAQMLGLGAKFEAARGDANRAAEYYKASLSAMPPVDFGTDLANELNRPVPVTKTRRPTEYRPQDLAALLATADPKPAGPVEQEVAAPSAYTRPYLPGAGNSANVPVPLNSRQTNGYPNTYPGSTPNYAPSYSSPAGTVAPAYGAQPTYTNSPNGTIQLRQRSKSSRLQDYVPQSEAGHGPMPDGVLHLHPVASVEAVYGPYVSYDPSVETPQMAADLQQAAKNSGVRSVSFEYQQTTTQDGTPVVPYAPNAVPYEAQPRPVRKKTPSELARQRAAQIRRNQDTAAPMTGVSRPPADNYDAVQIDNAQYNTQPFNPAQAQSSQVQRPQSQQQQSNTPTIQLQNTPSYTDGQQYPQPRRQGTRQVTPSARPRRRTTTQAPVEQQPLPPPSAPIQYPVYPQPAGTPGYPNLGQPYDLGTPPSDRDLIQQNVPPLRGYFDPRPEPKAPLTERAQTELDLATIDGQYSSWAGGTAYGRYRSGTAGVDRLAALEASFEVSLVVARRVRFTFVPKGVFLNSGILDTTTGTTGTTPILGTLPGNAINPPQQQFASGVGGEVQLVTNTFALAAGYTPYGFLVSNATGRVRWKPGNGHFTLFGGRDAVKQTMLSYAGLRDPGSSTINGNIWGGVIETGGGIRFDFGDEKSGLYVSAEGADVTGYHVLHNRKYDGTMGAYFRVKNWTDIGSLNVGGTLFGQHYNYNERYQTYGLGGYFSPNLYILAAVPVTFNGHHGPWLHYTVSGSVGLQTFQEDSQAYFPLDQAVQVGFGNLFYPLNSNTGLNYALDAQGAYQINDQWFLGAFLSGNNTNNYNTISGGFFARYTFKPQYASPSSDYPTGLFPIEGFRPIKVP